jgi:putative phosphoribosyl transferase
MNHRFRNRRAAGQRLAEALIEYANNINIVVLGLARGGIPVAFEVARHLHVLLDVCLVRKLGVPGSEELAMGAITAGGVQVLNEEIIKEFGITPEIIASVAAREQNVLTNRENLYRSGRKAYPLFGKTVLLIDDGLATGATMRAAIAAVATQKPAMIIVAVPVGARQICTSIAFAESAFVRRCVCLIKPEPLHAIGLWYEDFTQTSDAEVCSLLKQADEENPPAIKLPQ